MKKRNDTPIASLFAPVLAIVLAMPLCALASDGDEQFIAAKNAVRNGERVRLAKSVEALRGHDLQPWAEYWHLRFRLEDDPAAAAGTIVAFLIIEQGSYLGERLRGDWLRTLGKRGEWGVFEQEYPRLLAPEQDVACYALQARLARQDASALEEARPLWFNLLDLPDSCMPLMERLVEDKRLDADDAWERVRRMLEAKKLSQARRFARYLPHGQEPDGRVLESIADKPSRYLAKLPANFAATRLGREMVLYAVQRAARNDPQAAATQWLAVEERFSAAERGYAWGQLAWQAAYKHLPEALPWFDKVGAAPLQEEQLAWKLRAALRAGDWTAVHKTVAQMPAKMASEPTWLYWQGRALDAQGRHEEARALWRRIAGQPNFYGNLADEEMGRGIALPPRAVASTPDEIERAAAVPGLRRALALLRLDMRIDGVREWNWTLRGMDDRQLLAAAELARRNDIYDRAISAADRTVTQHDYALRYLAPFREQVEPKARHLELDHGWVYGLMRQESRFVMNAKSSAGAKGLMQLMPATAKWVAKKIRLASYHPSKTSDMDVNITLGTHYLKMVLASLDNQPVLASAAYNAGPGRAQRWRAERPLEGAIYAESIPFNETRDYVKKVMSNTFYYNALFGEKQQSLKSRLGIIRPRGNGESNIEDLP